MKARIRSGDFTPGAVSTPDETSTATAPLARIASATLSGRNPPARSHGCGASQPASTDHSIATALPPGRVAPAGARGSITKPSASPASGRSARSATATLRQTGNPKRPRISATRATGA